ncbi:MAG: TIGR00153 family protein [Planctomycetota bacterium]|nr:TIGR00153 family protein [Planctomycetota bacterium]
MRSIFSLFAKSPFQPLQSHMAKVKSCVERIHPLFDAVIRKDQAGADKLTQEICELESEADAIKNEIRSNLPRSLFLPIDRRDLLEILHVQDSLADECQDIAVTLTLRTMTVHDDLRAPLDRLLKEVTKVCMTAARIIEEFDELVETAFGGHEAEKVLEMIKELNAEETVTDEVGCAIAKKLFSLEQEMSPVEVMLWFRILRQVGELANRAEGIGNRLRLLLAK